MKAGWQTSTLGDVLAVIRNGVNCKQDKSGKGDRISRIESISSATFDLDKVGYAKLSERDKSKNLLQRGDILFSHINSAVHVGKTAVFDCDVQVYHGVNLLLMRPKENVTSAYLNHALKYLFQTGYWRGVCKQSVNQASVNQQDISRVEIRFPRSLTEQKRIVRKLDEAFAGLAKAKESAEKNLQNARALFESHLQSVFTQRGEGWVEKTFDDVCQKITDGTHHSPQTQFSERAPGTFPYITSKNIRNNFMDLSKMAYIEKSFHDEVYARCKPSLGDVLLTKDGANTGNVTLNTIDEPYSLLSSVCLIKTNQAVLKPAFLCFYLQSSAGLSAILGQMTGAAIKRIVLKDIKKAFIPFPPLKEQETIVATLNSMLAETQRLARIYEQKLEALESLKKSILHDAFSGNL